MHTQTLSRLMRLSWEIQRKPASKRKPLAYRAARSKALQAAWVIYLYEEITVYYLHKKHRHTSNPNKNVSLKTVTLF